MNNKLKIFGFRIVAPIYNYLYHKRENQYPVVIDSETTLNKLINERISFARFGDGEFNLIAGENIGFQNKSLAIANKLKEVLESNDSRCLIGIPDVFNGLQRFRSEAKFFWLYSVVSKWNRWKFFFCNQVYGDSLSSRFYMDVVDKTHSYKILSLWKKLWNDRNIVIVEGEHTKMGVGNDLFSNVKTLKRIICPSKDAFDKYELILKEVVKLDKKSIILLALGPTASILTFDLAKKGYQAVDIGHLDIEYNWLKCKSQKKVGVAGRFVNEISHQSTEKIEEKDYESQIIVKIV